jgi:hypothetical protein
MSAICASVRPADTDLTELTIGYSDSEDRLWLKSSEGAKYWLTRRLLLRFIAPTAELLEKTVPGGEVPNALPVAQRIALEHAEAMADTPEGQPAMVRNKETQSTAGTSAPPLLASGLSITADGSRCRLTILAADKENHLNLSRLDFHRILGAMALATRKAGWNLAGLPDWLGTDM